MTEQAEVTQADVVVATNVSLKVENLLQEASLLASSLGTSVTISNVLGAVLAHGQRLTERPMTRDEFVGVYDYVARVQAHLAASEFADSVADQQAAEPEPEATVGPEATAHAASSEEATELADHWGAKIADAALGFSPDGLAEWEGEFNG